MDDRTWTHAEEIEIGVAMSANPLMKELAEGFVLYQTHGLLDGFTSPLTRARVEERLGEEGGRRWTEIASKILEALGEQMPGT